MKKRALISVSDKTGIIEFAKGLEKLGFEIISTGGTAAALTKAGIPNIGISDVTNFPECLDGRVKTLHPAVHAGLLAMRDNPEHMRTLADLNINTIDVVAVNLYPFAATVAKPNVELAEAIENIDIGGPTMLRSAAKNYNDVIVVVEPSDYDEVIKRLSDGSDDKTFRLTLAYKVYRHTAVYDSAISDYLRGQLGFELPDVIAFPYHKKQDLRYGENPHQSAAFYAEPTVPAGSLAVAEQLGGKELSYNNINDAGGALDLLAEFDQPAAVAIKHANPCGAAVADDIFTAYKMAHDCDPTSIFGGIVAVNRELDEKTAAEMVKIFLEIIIAPSYTEGALKVLTAKQNLRVLRLPELNAKKTGYDFKRVYGGLLVQSRDNALYNVDDYKVVTKRAPTDTEKAQMDFAYSVVKHVKSNAIVLANDFSSVGVGAGQTNRIWAAQQAIEHAGDRSKGAVAASDAFFPFDDCVEALHKAGVTAIIQPGGSKRDEDSIKKCDEYGMAMVFVGMRHFKH